MGRMAVAAGLYQRFGAFHPLQPQPVGVIHKDDAVIHNDTREHKEAQHGND